jgi:hypothetical protein
MSDEKTISRLKQVATMGGLFDRAKAKPWLLVLVALAGGKGSEEVLARITEWDVQWWQVAIGVVCYGAMIWMRDVSGTLTKILERLGNGDARFEAHEKRIKALEKPRERSAPQVSPHPAH